MLQFGYLVMFAAACPLVALVMFVSNLVELRLDAMKLLRYVERPVPERTANIGIWNTILNNMFLCALITNVCEYNVQCSHQSKIFEFTNCEYCIFWLLCAHIDVD